VTAKARRHLSFHGGDLPAQGGYDHRQGDDRGGIDASNQLRLVQLLATQRGQDGVGLAGDVAAGALERGGYLRPGQPRGPARVGSPGQQLQRLRRIQVLEGLQRSGEVLPR
jgi:hypothetical protein